MMLIGIPHDQALDLLLPPGQVFLFVRSGIHVWFLLGRCCPNFLASCEFETAREVVSLVSMTSSLICCFSSF